MSEIELNPCNDSVHGVSITALTGLPSGTVLDERALAQALKVSTRTVRRMADRGEIPPGVRLGARKVWLSDKVLAFLSERAEQAEISARRIRKRTPQEF